MLCIAHHSIKRKQFELPLCVRSQIIKFLFCFILDFGTIGGTGGRGGDGAIGGSIDGLFGNGGSGGHGGPGGKK